MKKRMGFLLAVCFFVVTLIFTTSAAVPNYGNILYNPTAGNHQEYNRAIKLANGNILACTNLRNSTNSWGIRFYRSTDNGETFSFVTEFQDNSDGKTIGCETIFEVASGNILLAYTVYDELNYNSGMKLKIYRSTNNGSSWSYVTTLENWTWNWEPEFAISSDGRLQIFYSYSGNTMDMLAQAIVRRESTDGGTTWGNAITVKGQVGSSSPLNVGMPRVVKASDNLYYLAYEVYEDSACVHVSSGSDGKSFGSLTDSGVKMESSSGWMLGSPTLTYANGALIGIGKNYLVQQSMSDHPNSGKVCLISTNGGLSWDEMPLPLEIVYHDDHQNWSPAFLPLSSTQLFFITTSWLNGRDATVYDTGTITTGGNLPAGTYTIINKNSEKVLDVYQASIANGGNVVQWGSNGGNNQKWNLVDAGDGYYKIINVNSGKLLDVSGGSTADGGNVIQWSDNGGTNQLWKINDLGNGYYSIVNRKSGKLLDVYEASQLDGGNVVQWTGNNGDNQQWQLIYN